MSIWIRYLLAGLLACFSLSTLAADIAPLQQRWAEIQYQLPDNQKSAAFEALSAQAEQALAQEPDDAALLIWRGIILSSWAGAEGGLGALGKVKEAKSLFEHALQVDPQALQGSAYTSLGALYYQVPGWPIGFGDDEQAEALLQKALVLNPDGIEMRPKGCSNSSTRDGRRLAGNGGNCNLADHHQLNGENLRRPG